jgi:CDGSH-type Zn-finger protein
MMATNERSTNGGPVAGQKITVTPDGPYFVSGRVPLAERSIVSDAEGTACEWRAGKKLPAGESYSLCRCGHSDEKPFCSGAHVEVGFDGAETASRKTQREQAEIIKGPALTLADAEALCAGARFCHRAGGIWNLVPRSDDPEAKRIAIEEAADCPAGRLVVGDKEGKTIEPQFAPSIEVVEDPYAGVSGPLWVRGGIPVESADGTPYEVRNRVTLCRCGRSGNKPFCDGSHAEK